MYIRLFLELVGGEIRLDRVEYVLTFLKQTLSRKTLSSKFRKYESMLQFTKEIDNIYRCG